MENSSVKITMLKNLERRLVPDWRDFFDTPAFEFVYTWIVKTEIVGYAIWKQSVQKKTGLEAWDINVPIITTECQSTLCFTNYFTFDKQEDANEKVLQVWEDLESRGFEVEIMTEYELPRKTDINVPSGFVILSGEHIPKEKKSNWVKLEIGKPYPIKGGD